MLFSSTTFLIFFLPLTLAVYYLVGVLFVRGIRTKNLILLIASLIFYAWGEPVYIVLMLISIFFNYSAGRDIDNAKKRRNQPRAKAVFIAAIAFNLAVLGFFKYYGFLTENLNALLHLHIKAPDLPLPIGISFYTFQIMSYIIDLYRGKARVQKRFIPFALYVTLFPQLIAGPIVKYKDIAEQLRSRRENRDDFARGVTRFTVGLAKKLVLANTLGAVYASVQSLGAVHTSALSAWLGIFCYTLQIYFDFSGYSDMAIGLGGMFGFHFEENFNYPYIASSVTDFWRRWHISLSSWFRDYVYIPLGGNRRKTPRVILNLLIVWFLTGLWHGAAWNFIVWGLYYGVLLILEKYVLQKALERLPSVCRHLLTLLTVMLGWVFFSAPSLSEALRYIGAMFGGGAGFADANARYLLSSNIVLLAVGAFCATPLYKKLLSHYDEKTLNRIRIAAYPLLLLLCILFMVSETYNPFLYFRF